MLGSSALQHYCRVCNTQLNSCKQARIHVTGKKHEKRLAYLKFSLETSEAVSNNFAGQFVNNNGGSGPVQTAIPTVYAYPPPCGGYSQPTAPAYYFPQTYQTQHPLYHYDQQTTAPAPPAVSSSSSHTHCTAPPHPPCNTRRGKVSGTTSASHGVMSPSLTSGFSGSGDCKSTETCSLLSVASYSSAPPATATKERTGESNGNTTQNAARHVVTCEVCHLPFPSRAVLEHHLMGSRHARKVKAESVLRQLQEAGAEFRATQATGDIRCEVCEVSVNSSHQLQAHMTGRMITNCGTLLLKILYICTKYNHS